MCCSSCDRSAVEVIGGLVIFSSSGVCDRSATVLLGPASGCDRSAIVTFSCVSSSIGVTGEVGMRPPTPLVCDRSAMCSVDCGRSAKIGVVFATCDRSAMVCTGMRMYSAHFTVIPVPGKCEPVLCDRSAIDSTDCDRSARIGVVSTACDRSAMVCVGPAMFISWIVMVSSLGD